MNDVGEHTQEEPLIIGDSRAEIPDKIYVKNLPDH